MYITLNDRWERGVLNKKGEHGRSKGARKGVLRSFKTVINYM